MKKVLIIDDAMFTRSIHKQIVEAAGYQAIQASCGQEGLEKFNTEKPDIVMTDLLMPDMDGMEAVRKILATDPSATIFVCSADKQKYRQDEAREAGVKAFFPKPVNPEKLIETLKHLSES
ncbi:MAG TPA: hypothetical protein DCQ37_20295 [Desulfobacteraceae bacterium]|nr:hypothetical protein [Desulfobacteraceae bacterium]